MEKNTNILRCHCRQKLEVDAAHRDAEEMSGDGNETSRMPNTLFRHTERIEGRKLIHMFAAACVRVLAEHSTTMENGKHVKTTIGADTV